MSNYQRRRRTCSQCHEVGQWTLLELLWRLGGRGGWTWYSGWLCALDRAALLHLVELACPEAARSYKAEEAPPSVLRLIRSEPGVEIWERA